MDRYTHKNETRAPSYTTHENRLKWIEDLNARPETMKILEQSTGSKILHMAHSNILLNVSPQARETKEKVNKWDYIKLKSFCTAKETINKIKRQPTEWENMLANDTFDKRLISKFYEERIQLNTTKPNNPIKKWAENLNRNFSK